MCVCVCIEHIEYLLPPNMQQCEYDQLLVNLHMEATYIKEGMNIKWQYEVCCIYMLSSCSICG